MKLKMFLVVLAAGLRLQADYSFEKFRNEIKDPIQNLVILGSALEKAQEILEARNKINSAFMELTVQEKQDLGKEYAKLIERTWIRDQYLATSADTKGDHTFSALLSLKDAGADAQVIKAELIKCEQEVIERVRNKIFLGIFGTKIGNVSEYLKSQLSGSTSEQDILSSIMTMEGYLALDKNLDQMANVIHLSHFKEVHDVISVQIIAQINQSTKPVVVDCYATWCPPCKAMKPLFEALAEKYKEQYLFISVNIDEAQDFGAQFEVTGLPTFLFIKNGKVVDTKVGAASAEMLENQLKLSFAE